jgi:hypothetical protein
MPQIKFRAMDLTSPINRLAAGFCAFAANVRAYLMGGFSLRNLLTGAIVTVANAIETIGRLNDSTPAGPVAGFTYIITDSEGNLYCGSSGTLSSIAQGMSGNPVSIIPFRPNASVQPWGYIGDSAPTPTGSITYCTIDTEFALNGDATTFECSSMLKVRSDALIYKMGIMEPQTAPTISTAGTTTTGTDNLPATTVPWTNVGGANPDYNYGQTNGADGTGPVVISTPTGAQTLTLVVTQIGYPIVNGAVHAPGDAAPDTSTYPAYSSFPNAITNPVIVVGAFTDGSGNVLTGTFPVPILVGVGAGVTIQVPNEAVQFQVGIDSSANTFSDNSAFLSGNYYSIAWTLVTSAIATVISTLGEVTVYYYGDSPHSGPVAEYIWKNPNDSGSGVPRTSSQAVAPLGGMVTNNSWMFDSDPEDGTVPLLWDTLDSSGTITGSIPVFSTALESEGFQDFNMCVTGTIFVPAAGSYEFTFVNKDQIMVGIGGGATVSGGYVTGPNGQTESVINALSLIYVSTPDGTGGQIFQTISITFPGPGSYQVEIDYDYWYHSGRCLYMLLGDVSSLPPATDNIIPPLPQGVRLNTSYACKYRNSQTGAVSNPGPASFPEVTPVLDNTVTCPYSPDPQVDKVDFYRQDSGLANYTYVATGPNTNPPTPITDTLTDLEVADNQVMDTDDYEPFPSIDLPQSGVVNVSGNVITWVSGDVFNIRWLAGTIIEIGSPTQIAYSAVCRPTNHTTWSFVDSTVSIPDGTNLVYNIPEPILAAQPLAYLFGPTDNINYEFGVGDPLRPGTLYWCKGSNLDSAPDTNQMDVTDPSEPLVNGAMSFGYGVLFSIKRAWIIAPNYFNATATAQGVEGTTWSLEATEINRGLFMPRCVVATKSGNIFFRVDDGIHVSVGGLSSKSITDDVLYSLFSHEGSTPQPIVRNGNTIFPPDDTQPQLQKFSYQNGYLYYAYGYSGAQFPVTESASFTPASVASTGLGIPWVLPPSATGSGVGTNQIVQILEFSISDDIVTFMTGLQQEPLVEGQDVVVSGLGIGTYLNGQTLTVEAAGLTTTSFSASFSHSDVGSTYDTGIITPTTTFASAQNVDFGAPTGQITAWAYPEGTPAGPGFSSGSCFGSDFAPFSFIAGDGYGAGANGCPLGAPAAGWESNAVASPNLPEDAEIQSIVPCSIGTTYGSGGSASLTLVYTGGTYHFFTTGTLQKAPNFGTDLSVLDGMMFAISVGSSLEADPDDPYSFGCNITFFAVAVNYTTATSVSPTQLQTLAATNCGLAIPSGDAVSGVQVNIQTGMAYGSAANLIVQLTLDGEPVGTPKGILIGPWATSYVLGGDTDLWGLSGLVGSQVNGSDGLGVNVYGSLPSNAQINLNSLNGEVFYINEQEVEGYATLVFDEAAMGWVLDAKTPEATAYAPNEGQSVQGILVGCTDGTVRMLTSGGTESATAITLSSAIGGSGWQHVKEYTIEYLSNSTITITPVVVDTDNNSYAPNPINLPSTGGTVQKLHGLWSPNKWKLLQFQIAIVNDLTAQVYLDGFSVQLKSWGATGAYQPVNPFSQNGGFGGQV